MIDVKYVKQTKQSFFWKTNMTLTNFKRKNEGLNLVLSNKSNPENSPTWGEVVCDEIGLLPP